ncbi:MAG: CDP-alcohol phosphatidyltransferase family protein [Oscillospiraceae bacterium]|jgi:CDP-diacylglycerol--glycerol-3-phosphate 3-phosphatidyltransferase|nr:CDP-alcohol phosphatidyltransferase family protein [Oscillospiraceae bacterium]
MAKKKFIMYLPNIVSLIRIVGVISLPFLMWESWEKTIDLFGHTFTGVPLIWCIVYLVLVLTDKVDGTLARKLHAESDLGAELDALGDALIIVVGGLCVFIKFVNEKLTVNGYFWWFVGIMVWCVLNKVVVLLLSGKYFEKGNMLHSYPQKLFAFACFVAVPVWAFLRDLPLWSILLLLVINLYATIDEIVYIVRAKEYDVDFKGNGFEKYELR